MTCQVFPNFYIFDLFIMLQFILWWSLYNKPVLETSVTFSYILRFGLIILYCFPSIFLLHKWPSLGKIVLSDVNEWWMQIYANFSCIITSWLYYIYYLFGRHYLLLRLRISYYIHYIFLFAMFMGLTWTLSVFTGAKRAT